MNLSRSLLLSGLFSQSLALSGAGLRARLRGTVFGAAWVFALPLLSLAVQLYAFQRILRIDLPEYPVYLLSGLLPWIWITQSFDMGFAALHGQAPLFRASPVHPLAVLTGSFFGTAFSSGIPLLLLAFATAGSFSEALIRFACLVPALLVFATCVLSALICLSVLQVRLRDTRFLVHFLMGLLYFASPIFYGEESWPEAIRPVLAWNPVYAWIRPVRLAIYEPLRAGYGSALFTALVLAIAQIALARLLWQRGRKAVYVSA